MESIKDKLVIAISSRALFDLQESEEIFKTQGIKAYAAYQLEHENDILAPGSAFEVVKKLLNLNQYGPFVEVILLSRNSADTGLRVFNSIQHYKLNIIRAAFTNGSDPYHYARAFNSHLFLSSNPKDVSAALNAGFAAANIYTYNSKNNNTSRQLRIAFDGDAVLFSASAEKIFYEQGIDAFIANETKAANKPLPAGPFHGFLLALHKLQQQLEPGNNCPIRTALVTARSAPTHERVIRTLRAWEIRIDESFFLGGLDKTEFLKSFNADIFFDDQRKYCDLASKHVTTGHVA